MKLLKTEITPLINNLIHVEIRDQVFLQSPFHSKPCLHAHPELELTYIIQGSGTRIIGNIVEKFEPGDMVFIGVNVPHVWLSDASYYKEQSLLKCKAVVAYINPIIFLEAFSALREFDEIRELIRQSEKGFRISGETRISISTILASLVNKNGFEKVEGVLQILNLLSRSSDKTIVIRDESEQYQNLYSDKLISVINYMKENIHSPISLQNAAVVAGMTQQSFCRYFKQRTRKNFTVFLNDLRMSAAGNLLIQTEKSISEVATLCGFSSSSEFCRKFKIHAGISPRRYKATIQDNILI